MTIQGGASFGDPTIDLAVETAAQLYGDDREAVFRGLDDRRRSLTVAASALFDAGHMSLAEAARLFGLNERAVRVSRCRKSQVFRIVEEVVVAVLAGETRDLSAVAEQVAAQVSLNAAKAAHVRDQWKDPARRAAFSSPEAIRRRAEGRAARLAADPEAAARMAEQARANLRKAGAARLAKRAAGLSSPPKRRPPPEHVARKLPYIRRFLAAGWSKGETAKLFDVTWRTVDRVANG